MNAIGHLFGDWSGIFNQLNILIILVLCLMIVNQWNAVPANVKSNPSNSEAAEKDEKTSEKSKLSDRASTVISAGAGGSVDKDVAEKIDEADEDDKVEADEDKKGEEEKEDDGEANSMNIAGDEDSTVLSDGEKTDSDDDDDDGEKLDPVQTLLVFDWDDTLFPTTAVHKQTLYDMLADNDDDTLYTLIDTFGFIDVTIKMLLCTARSLGTVVIISNASKSWMDETGERFIKEAYRFIRRKSIQVISAKDLYCEDDAHDYEYSNWKRKAIEQVIEDNAHKSFTNIITIGDSEQEHNAVAAVSRARPGCVTKQMWCKRLNSPMAHRKQLLALDKKLERVALKPTDEIIKV